MLAWRQILSTVTRWWSGPHSLHRAIWKHAKVFLRGPPGFFLTKKRKKDVFRTKKEAA
jgi:hypothetical protein